MSGAKRQPVRCKLHRMELTLPGWVKGNFAIVRDATGGKPTRRNLFNVVHIPTGLSVNAHAIDSRTEAERCLEVALGLSDEITTFQTIRTLIGHGHLPELGDRLQRAFAEWR